MTYLKAIKGQVVVNFPLHTNQRKKDGKTKETQEKEKERRDKVSWKNQREEGEK